MYKKYKNPKQKNVITDVVSSGICCGCGICAGVANKCLSMVFDCNGEYKPKLETCTDCGLCLTVCPFYKKDVFLEPLGDYLANYVGYSQINVERLSGASGGLVTRLLKSLLDRGMINGAVVVGKSNKDDRLFEPIIAYTTKQIELASSSKYYPIEFSHVLRVIKENEGLYAVVGLPCVVNGLRYVQQKYPTIGKKIKYLFGLACGHNKNKNYTSMLLNLANADIKNTINAFYRSKDSTIKTSNYGFRGILSDNIMTKQLNFCDTLIKDLWCKRYFSLKSCFYCKDMFADRADLSFMDAWLEPFSQDWRGTSIVTVRNKELNTIIQEEIKIGNIYADSISSYDVIQSQEAALKFKNKCITQKYIFLFNRFISNQLYSKRISFRHWGILLIKIHIHITNAANIKKNILTVLLLCKKIISRQYIKSEGLL